MTAGCAPGRPRFRMSDTAVLPLTRTEARGATRWLSMLLLVATPFCAVAHVGLLGNFDSNFALLPFLMLAVLFLLDGSLFRTLMLRGRYGAYLRMLVMFLLACAVLTVLNGMRWQALDMGLYGLDPLQKSIVTSIVPVFLAVLVLVGVLVAQRLEPASLDRAITFGFWLAVGYTALQVASTRVSLPVYDAIYPYLEGARPLGDTPYIKRFGRINGPTLEPAEFAKLLLLFFLPWAVYPAVGTGSALRVVLVLALAVAAGSIVGILTIVLVAAVLMGSRLARPGVKVAIVILLWLVALAALLFGDMLFARLAERLSMGLADASTLIRATYNRAAIDLVLEHPLIGVGWSNELFLFPEKVSQIAHLWEVQNDLATGNALTAKSLFLRLLMYAGIPLMAGLVLATLIMLRPVAGRPAAVRALARLRLAFVVLGLGGMIDGGILTSFYLWLGPALCLGAMLREDLATAES